MQQTKQKKKSSSFYKQGGYNPNNWWKPGQPITEQDYKLLDRVRVFYSENGYTPTKADMADIGYVSNLKSRFRIWKNVIIAAGLPDINSAENQKKRIEKQNEAKKNIIDESGYMDDDFEITKNVKLTTKDIREFQLAKSAVISAIKCLIKFADITFDDIENMYVAGGFSDKLDVKNATHLGLFPEELMGKFRAVNNTSLLGTVKYSYEHNNLDKIAQQSEYVDLGKDETFSEMFFENMSF